MSQHGGSCIQMVTCICHKYLVDIVSHRVEIVGCNWLCYPVTYASVCMRLTSWVCMHMSLFVIVIFACLYLVIDCIACLCLRWFSAQPWVWVLDFRQPNPACYPRRHLKWCCVAGGPGVSNAEGYCFVTGSLSCLVVCCGCALWHSSSIC